MDSLRSALMDGKRGSPVAVSSTQSSGNFFFRALFAMLLLLAAGRLLANQDDTETDMALSPTKSVGEILAPTLGGRGFVRSGNRWLREESESIILVELQPAKYSAGPYINFGVYYRKYGNEAPADNEECHLSTRLESVIPLADALQLDNLLDPNSSLSKDERRVRLANLVVTYGLPWLEGLTRFSTARAFLAKETSKGVFIAPALRKELRPAT